MFAQYLFLVNTTYRLRLFFFTPVTLTSLYSGWINEKSKPVAESAAETAPAVDEGAPSRGWKVVVVPFMEGKIEARFSVSASNGLSFGQSVSVPAESIVKTGWYTRLTFLFFIEPSMRNPLEYTELSGTNALPARSFSVRSLASSRERIKTSEKMTCAPPS
jgi:hypothetical protein